MSELEQEEIEEEEEEKKKSKRKQYSPERSEKVVKKHQKNKKLTGKHLIPQPVLFFKISPLRELSLLIFRKKYLKRRLILPPVIYESLKEYKMISFPLYKRRILKRKLVLPTLNFSKITLHQIVAPVSFKREFIIKSLILPQVYYSKILLQEKIKLIQYVCSRKLEGREIEKHQATVEVKTYTGSEGILGKESSDSGVNRTLIDLLFERRTWGNDVIESREPYIIFLIERESEGVKEIVKSILQRLIEEMENAFEGCREESIGFEDICTSSEPGGKKIANENKKLEEKRIIEITRNLDVSRKIFVINLNGIKSLDKLELVSIVDRINELKGAGLGFLVFHLTKECKIDDIEKWLEKLEAPIRLTYQPNIQIWKLKKDVNYKIVGDAVGYDISELISLFRSEKINKMILAKLGRDLKIDLLFEFGRRLQLEKRVKIRKLLSEIVNRNEGELESELHYDLKCLVVFRLIKQTLGNKDINSILENPSELINLKEKIKTEEAIKNKDTIISIPDIQFKEEEVWEIETLFSEGVKSGDPLKKIDETIKKYENDEKYKINIVIDNLTFLLHYPELKRKYNFWKELKNDKIKFWVPNWEKEDLRPVFEQ
jgi:hypothetical protein